MYISPKHNTATMPDKPVSEWEIELMIDFFFHRIDGWHLEIANRCINGWQDEAGNDYIQGKHRDGSPANYIADSGWAVLQIVLNYFETIAFFKLGGYKDKGKKNKYNNRKLFADGFFDVFPECETLESDKEKVIDLLWKGLRVGLYHGDVIDAEGGETILGHRIDSPAVEIYLEAKTLFIDPHKFVPQLRKHLRDYRSELLDEVNEAKRNEFIEAFKAKFGESD